VVKVGDWVVWQGRECRVVATSGTDSLCMVRWGEHDDQLSGWILQDTVQRPATID
jgi:hypothetical protein